MITSVTVLSYEQMMREAMHNRIPENAFIVSIIDPEEDPIFDEDTDRIITLRFHDLDPKWFEPQHTSSYVFMSEEQAKQIAAHVFKHADAEEEFVFYVNCMAGISRSGAVGTFAARVAGISDEEFRAANHQIMPNGYILSLLMREWYKRQWPDLEE